MGRWLAGLPGPWWVAGGWAIDLWLGEVSREHEDIEVSVLRADQQALYAHCGDWRRFTPREDIWVPMGADEQLELPEFQVQVRPPALALAAHPGLPAEFEFMLNDVADGAWRFRPEPTIRRAWERVIVVGPFGIPAVAPELVLLHKARHHRPKDEHDFAHALPHLDAERRAWFRAALAQIRPADPWLTALDDGQRTTDDGRR